MNTQTEMNLSDLKLLEHQHNEFLNNLSSQGANEHQLKQVAAQLREAFTHLKHLTLDTGHPCPPR